MANGRKLRNQAVSARAWMEDMSVLDVKDKLVVFRTPEPTRLSHSGLARFAQIVFAQGALGLHVCALTDKVEALDDDTLAKLGLMRIPTEKLPEVVDEPATGD